MAACLTVNTSRGYCRDSLVDHGREQGRAHHLVAPDPHLSGARDRPRLDLPHPLAQVVEDRGGPFKQGAAIERRLDPVRLRSRSATPSVYSISAIAFDTAGWESASCAAAFPMLPACATAVRMRNSRNLRAPHHALF